MRNCDDDAPAKRASAAPERTPERMPGLPRMMAERVMP
jgi:hypothetical protein